MELVQHFVDLLNQQKFDEAYLLLGSNAAGSDLRDELRRMSNLNIKVLETPPPQQEGAAGSIYVTVGIWIAGLLAEGLEARQLPVALATWGMVWSTSSYFVSRSDPSNVSNLPLRCRERSARPGFLHARWRQFGGSPGSLVFSNEGLSPYSR